MSFRERFKQSVKEIKGDVKALFNRQDVSRPTTPASAPHQPGSLGVNVEHINLDASVPRTCLVQDPIPRSPPTQTSHDDTPQAPQMPDPIEEIALGMVIPGENTLEAGPQESAVNITEPINQTTTKSHVVKALGQTSKTDNEQLDKPPSPPGQAPQSTSVMRDGAKELARVLGPVANIFGPVKEMVDVFIGCIDQYKVAESARVEYESLALQVGGVLQDLARFFGQGTSLTMTLSMEGICRSIKSELKMAESKLGRNVGVRYLEAQDDIDVILGCYRRICSHLQRLSLNANLEMWKVVEEQASDARSDRIASLVDRLPSSLSARYNSAEGAELRRRGCTPDTRVDVLALIQGWTSRSGEGAVYWMNGMAGTGKTTIAYSTCERLTFERKLAASFFCSRLRSECRNVNLIFPSIAYQLARFSRPFMSALSEILKQDPDVHTSVLHVQFEGLIAKPLSQVGNTLPDGLVVVIDALDECDNKDTTRKMLDLLLNQAANLPIRFIVSSRPEPEIRSRMSMGAKSRLVLHELDKGEVQADIKKYLREGLARIGPSEEQIEALAEKAGILFIYAATAVRYIGFDDFEQNPQGRLRTILNRRQGQRTMENTEIDELYSTILQAAFGKRGLEEEQLFDMRLVLYTVVCAREPLTVKALSEMLQINDVDRVRAALRPLWSVLHVVEASELVTTLHASFPDYMFDSARSLKYHCNSETHHLKLAELCFEQMMRTHSQFDICGLESSYLFNEKVINLEERVIREISLELLYACRYWATHVDLGSCASSVVERLQEFLSTRLLLWMEVLNLNKQMKAGTECMKLTVDWCKAMEGEHDLIQLAQDAKRFVETFASNPVSQSTPHLYVSMLAFWPKSSPITKHYAKYTQGPAQPEGTALDRRQLAHLSTWAFEKGTGAIAVSPDGLAIAVGVGIDVVVVDSSSGRKLLEPLKGHTYEVDSIAFSPDGTRVFAGSSAGNYATIVGWDTRSGDVVLGPLQLHGHNDGVYRLRFSPDCIRVATGSADKTARLWDAETGKMLHCLPTDGYVYIAIFSSDGTRLAAGADNTLHIWNTHTGKASLDPVTHAHAFYRVAFLPDGLRIISSSAENNAIYVWDVQTGDMILGPIPGHMAYIQSIGCSHDGRYIVSGSADRTVCVWDAQNGDMVIGPLQAHTGYITSVAFTPDGSRIISACEGGLVCAWDAQQRTLATSSTNTPTDQITCVKFTSDGTRFVSGSEQGTICIWDAYTGEMQVGPIKAHTSEINAVAVWMDRVVSGAYDSTICICDVLSGEVVLGPLQVVSGGIWSIAYSPDGQMIATGSSDGVDGWNAQSGERVFGPLTGLRDAVVSVEFSPDGTRIVGSSVASGSKIAVWDVSTGKSVFGTIDGHDDYVRSVSYSPNGTLIASASDDNTIIVWDADTGKKRLGPLTGHSDWVDSVHFSPDSTRLVSGSGDRTIRIWDVQTGEMIFELLHGHEHWIMSVEYSPDGTRILSCSYDMSVRIHDARSAAERALTRSDSEVRDWTINKDGWVVDDQSRLLVWVPGDLRKALMWARTQVMIAPQGYVRLKFDKSRMGESWAESYKSGM